MLFKSKSAMAQRGFTLLELLVVLVILGMLAALAGPRVMKYISSAKSDTAQLQIEELAAALDMYKLEVGRHPNTQEGLQALVEAPGGATNWNGPYLKKKTVPKDPWGADYIYAPRASMALSTSTPTVPTGERAARARIGTS